MQITKSTRAALPCEVNAVPATQDVMSTQMNRVLNICLNALGDNPEALGIIREYCSRHSVNVGETQEDAQATPEDTEEETQEDTQEPADLEPANDSDSVVPDLESSQEAPEVQEQQTSQPAPAPTLVLAPIQAPPRAKNKFNEFQSLMKQILKTNNLGKSLRADQMAPIYHQYKGGLISIEEAVQKVLEVKSLNAQLAMQTLANRPVQTAPVQQQPVVRPSLAHLQPPVQQPRAQPYTFYVWRQFQAEIKRRCNGKGVYSTQASHLYKIHKYNQVTIEDIVAIVMSMRRSN